MLKLFPIQLLIVCALLCACAAEVDIKQIGEDIQLQLPNEFTTLSNQEDWLGFDLTQQYDLQFSDTANIETQILESSGYAGKVNGFNSDNSIAYNSPNSRWFKGDNGRYGYRFCKETVDVTEYCILASFEPRSGILRYRFMDF